MKIPWDALSSDVLRAIVEDFVTREGTEYGASEVSVERKVEQVLTQLKAGTATITYNPTTDTTTIQAADA